MGGMRIVITALLYILSVVTISTTLLVLDFFVLPRLLGVPEDACAYHTEDAPWWIETFYMDSSGHVGVSGWHVVIFPILSLVFAFYVTRSIHKKLRRKTG